MRREFFFSVFVSSYRVFLFVVISFVDDLNSGVLTRFLLLCLHEGDLNGF